VVENGGNLQATLLDTICHDVVLVILPESGVSPVLAASLGGRVKFS
jgi:hypothetical protein